MIKQFLGETKGIEKSAPAPNLIPSPSTGEGEGGGDQGFMVYPHAAPAAPGQLDASILF